MSQKFTVDWFSHNIPIWTETFDSFGWLHSAVNLRVLEVGSWEGQSACWLLQHVCCSSGSSLVCIDNWAGAKQYGSAAKDWGLSEKQHHGTAVLQRFRDNIEAVQGTDKVTVLQQPSWVALSTMMQNDLETFDVSSHRSRQASA
ncbi:hypothetical protein ABBQ38_004408 [Trebouxia sp. C0009 RCD-2024]